MAQPILDEVRGCTTVVALKTPGHTIVDKLLEQLNGFFFVELILLVSYYLTEDIHVS